MALIFNFAAPNTQSGGDDVNTIKIYESTDALSFTLVKTDSINASDTSYTYTDGSSSRYYRFAFVDASGLPSPESDTLYGGDIYDGETLSSQSSTLLNTYLYPMIKEFQEIGVFDEVGIYYQDGKVRFEYPRWNTSREQQIRKNGTLLTNTTDYALNATYGYIIPTTTPSETDEYSSRYRFSYFENTELLTYIDLAISNINAKNPGSAYTRDTIDLSRYGHVVTQGAYVSCLKRLSLDNMIWRNKLIWADPQAALSLLQATLSAAMAEYTAMLADLTRRQLLVPKTIKAGRYGQDYTVTGNNFWRFTVLGN